MVLCNSAIFHARRYKRKKERKENTPRVPPDNAGFTQTSSKDKHNLRTLEGKALEFLPSNRRTYRWRPGGPTAQRSLITVAYNQYVDAPLKKFAAHVDTFNPVGPGLPPPDARDHHDAPGAHAETTPSFKRSTVVMFPCSSGIRSLTKSQESSLGTNMKREAC
jgi:hypothetical protein